MPLCPPPVAATTLIAGLAAGLAAGGAVACSAETDCQLDSGRAYRIDLPEGTPRGAILFAHGYRGSAAGTMRNGGLREIATARGLAFVALGAADADWDLPHAPRTENEDGAEEFAYVQDTIDDISARFAVPSDRLMMAGFSAGGMFVWNMACAYPQAVLGYLSVSGTYWQGPPESCALPVATLLHIHGRSDGTVPLEGRPIADTRQGRVADALAQYEALGGFRGTEGLALAEGLDCGQSANADGARLTLCLHDGGHSFRNEFVAAGWDWLTGEGD